MNLSDRKIVPSIESFENGATDFPVDLGANQNGIVYAANESRFSAANFSEPLTAFALGWKDPENIEDLLNFVAPVVQVGKRFEFKKTNAADAFLSESDDIRANGSAFKRVEFFGTSIMGKTLNKGLTVRVDHDDIAGDDWRERYIQLLLRRLYRNELRRAIEALKEGSQGKNYLWSMDENGQKNPDADLRSALSEAVNQTGIRPNRILFGERAWDLRLNVYDLQSTSAAQRAAMLSMDDLAQRLFVDEIRVLRARFQGDGERSSAILDRDIYLFYTRNELIKDEPANIKRFVTPIDGNNFRVYVEEHAKFTDLTVEHYSNIMVTSSAGIVKLSIAETAA